MDIRKTLRQKPESPPAPPKHGRRKIFFTVLGVIGLLVWFQPVGVKFLGSMGGMIRLSGKGDQKNPDIPSDRTLFAVSETLPKPDSLRTVRIGTWNLYPLDYAKITDPIIGRRIAETIASFDLIAIEGFRTKNKGVADGLLYRVNQTGNGRFDFIVSSSSRPGTEFQTFFFNQDRIQVDRDTLFEMTDPFGRLAAPPLISNFCAANVDPARRFTFTLISVRARSDSPPDMEIFADVYKTVRARVGRGGVTEDDVILLGSFEKTIGQLGKITTIPNLVTVSAEIPTDFQGRAVDHIIFDERSTTEYVEKFGIMNLADRFGVSVDQARRVADHFPIWADFSVIENEE